MMAPESAKDAASANAVVASDPAIRSVTASDAACAESFPDNTVTNTKYTPWNFFFMQVKEQFRRPMNQYFLLIAILQSFPVLTPVNPLTTWIPLAFAFALTAVKEGYDDYLRYKEDKKFNARTFWVSSHGGPVQLITSAEIRVGDVIKIMDHDEIPCDVVLLATSEPSGQCYIQTTSLDGESDLKPRFVSPEVVKLIDAATDADKLQQILITTPIRVECATPNADIYKFDSRLLSDTAVIPLATSNMLLQCTHLRNTAWAYGVAVYTGNDTKCGMNKRTPPTKTTRADDFINRIAVGIFCVQLVIVIIFGTIGGVLKNSLGRDSFYLAFMPSDPWYEQLVIPIRFLLLCSMLIPISLKVTLDLVRYAYAWFINWDIEMYDAPTDTPAKAVNTSLSEELGVIECVMTDKTGTLTENIMTFRGISARGCVMTADQVYAYFEKSAAERASIAPDSDLLAVLRLLCLCNSVVPSFDSNGNLFYKASSPDEESLVIACQTAGVVMQGRSFNSLTLRVNGVEEVYDLLEVLNFTASRKRMSVIIRSRVPGSDPILLVKGADDVILPRVINNELGVKEKVSHDLIEFGLTGLRTLCLASRPLPSAFYDEWKTRFTDANTAIQDRDAKIAALFEEMECELSLVGCTAIEDRLQDQVADTIRHLRSANISFWMLTGDKFETAIQIAKSCQLIGTTDEIVVVEGEDAVESSKSLAAAEAAFRPAAGLHASYVIVIRGSTLAFVMADAGLRSTFQNLAFRCGSIVCCRVTPSQKAAVVALAKEKGKRCLAIGDGGNDVSMIQEAHVGVGISGREGLQAARAADYAIGQFRFLARLVLVHGHLSYHRTSFIAQYSFYKSFILAAIQVLYNCFSMFSGVTFFNSLSLVSYNVVFTFLPTFLYALDQHLTTRELSTMAKAYAHSQRSLGLNWKTVFGWYARGITQALILFFFTYGIYSSTFTHKDSGHPIDYASINVVTFTALVSLQTVTMVIESNYMTGFNAFVIIGCYVVYWAFVFVYNTIKSSDFYNVMNMHAGDGVFWLAQLLITTACILPVLAVRYLRLTFWPSLIHAWHIYLRKAKATSDSFIEMVPMRSKQLAP